MYKIHDKIEMFLNQSAETRDLWCSERDWMLHLDEAGWLRQIVN